jgi:hypothetical protein
MKQETKNEMDVLLRRLGRRDDAVLPDAGHLDADELSAYAENVLPAAARARYTAHLAECSRCRELVVQLSASAGVVVATESVNATGPAGWRKFLASLFTPMVLRYAVPALGLIVVAVIGFVILRRDQPTPDVAQVTNTEQRPAAPPATQPDGSINYSLKSSPSPDQSADKRAKGLQAESPASPPNAAPVVSSVDTEVANDAAAAQPKPEQKTTAANEPPPPPKPSATPTPEEAPRPEPEVSKREVREMPATASPAAANKTLMTEGQRKDKDDIARRRGATDDVSAAGTGSVARIQRDGLDQNANTRSVAGRRFRKQNGIWIDTAYDSSKDTVSLTRGSEQYRALVADEPAIKTIADTLNGEIILVWKGHTYRIR